MLLTGWCFSCWGMGSGTGRGRALGLVRENSWGSVFFLMPFLIWLPWDTLEASWSVRISISGRHLGDKDSMLSEFIGQQGSWFYAYGDNMSKFLHWHCSTWAAGQSSSSLHMRHHRSDSIHPGSKCWGLSCWRRNSETAKPETMLSFILLPQNSCITQIGPS